MEMLSYFLLFFAFVFVTGLCIGSFLNVVVLRAFSEESIVFPASKCPKCQNPLMWWHNIPVLSYVFLKGKCAYCHEKISIQYPIVELITAIMFVAVFIKFNFSWTTLFMLAITSMFIVLAVTDLKEKVIFDYHAYFLVGFGLAYNIYLTVVNGFSWSVSTPIISSIFGLVAGVIIMELLARSGYLLVGQRAFGEGDSFIAAGLGAVFGWKLLLMILVYSVAIQLICTIPLFLKKLWKQGDFITFNAFIGFFVYVLAYKYLAKFDFLTNIWVYTVAIFILLALGIFVCRRILAGLKNPDGMTYMPFGPAMVFGALIAMFMM